jgi:hypothetical protein
METYKGEPLEEMYELWMTQKVKKEEMHRKKLERDRKAKARYRAKQREVSQDASD